MIGVVLSEVHELAYRTFVHLGHSGEEAFEAAALVTMLFLLAGVFLGFEAFIHFGMPR